MTHTHPEHSPANFESQQTPSTPTRPKEERCGHEPDGMQLDENNRVVSRCEQCGAPLIAEHVHLGAMQRKGELHVTQWREG